MVSTLAAGRQQQLHCPVLFKWMAGWWFSIDPDCVLALKWACHRSETMEAPGLIHRIGAHS
jgi:hypothetical protein